MKSVIRSLMVLPLVAVFALPVAAQQGYSTGPRLLQEAEHVDNSHPVMFMTASAHSRHRRARARSYRHARSKKKSAAIIGGSALGGAAIGGLAGGGKGAAIGAAAGAGGGYIYDRKTNHRKDLPK
ncbi:MAG: hypothetical protein NVS9B15_00880 [Acidobacteriaceae bacterium]